MTYMMANKQFVLKYQQISYTSRNYQNHKHYTNKNALDNQRPVATHGT